MVDDLIGTKFGPEQQLEVIGWFGDRVDKYEKGDSRGAKNYTVKCNFCSKDPELFGDAVFLLTKRRIITNSLPCGCAGRTLWTEEQLKIKIKRECSKRDYEFIGWFGDFNGTRSILQLEYKGHYSCNLKADLFLRGLSCRHKKRLDSKMGAIYPVEWHINKFMATGKFKEGTTFTKIDTRDRKRKKPFWVVFCTYCNIEYQSTAVRLTKGQLGCNCIKNKPNKAYIMLVKDCDIVVCIKFGVSVNPLDRLSHQSAKSIYATSIYGVWKFPDSKSCLMAEKEVKRCFETSVIPQEEFKDGFTETTYPSNIDAIIKIYELSGGERLDEYY